MIEPESAKVSSLRALHDIFSTALDDAPLVQKKPEDAFGCVFIKTRSKNVGWCDFTVEKHATSSQAHRVTSLFKGIVSAFQPLSEPGMMQRALRE